MSKPTFFVSLTVASVFAGLSVLMLRIPEGIGAAVVLLFPGFMLGMVIGGNVHDFSTWAVALGNFLFYFGLVYLGCGIWERHRRRVGNIDRDDRSDN